MKTKTKWEDLPLECWSIKFYREDDDGNMKFYTTTDKVDHSSFCEGLDEESIVELDENDSPIETRANDDR